MRGFSRAEHRESKLGQRKKMEKSAHSLVLPYAMTDHMPAKTEGGWVGSGGSFGLVH